MARKIKLDEALRVHLEQNNTEYNGLLTMVRMSQENRLQIWEIIKSLYGGDLNFEGAIVQNVEKENEAILILPFENETTEGEGK